MPIRALLSVNGYDFPDPLPSGYEANTATIVDGGRNLNGDFIGNVINVKRKVSVTWPMLKPEQWARMLACFDPNRGGSFVNNVVFYNQDIADWDGTDPLNPVKMYVSDRNAGLWRCDPETGIPIGWVGTKLSLVEV